MHPNTFPLKHHTGREVEEYVGEDREGGTGEVGDAGGGKFACAGDDLGDALRGSFRLCEWERTSREVMRAFGLRGR